MFSNISNQKLVLIYSLLYVHLYIILWNNNTWYWEIGVEKEKILLKIKIVVQK